MSGLLTLAVGLSAIAFSAAVFVWLAIRDLERQEAKRESEEREALLRRDLLLYGQAYWFVSLDNPTLTRLDPASVIVIVDEDKPVYVNRDIEFGFDAEFSAEAMDELLETLGFTDDDSDWDPRRPGLA